MSLALSVLSLSSERADASLRLPALGLTLSLCCDAHAPTPWRTWAAMCWCPEPVVEDILLQGKEGEEGGDGNLNVLGST